MPWQSLPPFIIMVGAIAAIGAGQYGVHYLYHGETKKIGRDNGITYKLGGIKIFNCNKMQRQMRMADITNREYISIYICIYIFINIVV